MLLEIDTTDQQLAFDLFETTSLDPSVTRLLPGGAHLTYQSTHARKAFGIPETIELALSFGTGVGSSMLAGWLFQKLKGRPRRIRIDRREVEIDEGQIKRVIEEHIHVDS